MIGPKEAEDWQRHTSDALLWTTEAATPSRGSSTQVPLLLASRWQALEGDADKRMDRRFAQALPRHSWRHHHKHRRARRHRRHTHRHTPQDRKQPGTRIGTEMDFVSCYNVIVTSEGGSWLADVPAVPGADTFARSLTSLAKSVREVIT